MKIKKLDTTSVGLILGLIMPVIGVFVYYKIAGFWMNFHTFIAKVRDLGVSSKVLSLGVLANLVIFLIFINLDFQRTSRGILIATFIYAAIILAMKFIL